MRVRCRATEAHSARPTRTGDGRDAGADLRPPPRAWYPVPMRDRKGHRARLLLSVLLLAAVSCCLVQVPAIPGHDHDHGRDHDAPHALCLGMVVITLGLVLLPGLLPSGWAVPLLPSVLRARPIQVLDPPPRVLSLA